MNKPMLSIITPVYNRVECMNRLHSMLCKQTDSDFEWIIIDDGSTDCLGNLVKSWKSNFKVVYQWKTNGGKATAVNVGLALAEGENIVVLDSDDEPLIKAVEEIRKTMARLDEDSVGAGFLICDRNGNVLGNRIKPDFQKMTILDAYAKKGFSGDKWFVFKARQYKQYRFPICDSELLVPEGTVYNRMSRDGMPVVFVDKCLLIAEYLGDGYSENIVVMKRNSPCGFFRFYYENLISRDLTLNEYYIKSFANIIALPIAHGNKPILQILIFVVAAPVGIMLGLASHVLPKKPRTMKIFEKHRETR